jgi:hypothetical protein
MPVIAYRTENGCGWGVKALEKIKERISALLILYFIQQSRLNTVSEDVATYLVRYALAVRRSNHSARSHYY